MKDTQRAKQFSLIASVFVLVTSVYLLTCPGRIEFFDGQVRYEVARNIVDVGRPIIADTRLRGVAVRGRGGAFYSGYGPGASVSAVPLMLLSRLWNDPRHQLEHIAFSFTSAIYGGGVAALVLRFLLTLGLSARRAVGGTLVAAFASLVWPSACSIFDNTQHTFWLLLSLFMAHQSAQQRSRRRALVAGVAGGLLFLYQEAFGFVLPALALASLSASGENDEKREGYRRYALFGVGASTGLLMWAAYNAYRFGNPFFTGKLTDAVRAHHPPVWGNPLIGAAGLLVSPGKGVVLYSPTVLLGIVGLRGLWRSWPRLSLAIIAASGVHLSLMSSMTFWAGDWSWGPRYLVPVLGLLSIAAPFAEPSQVHRAARNALIAVAVVVQVMALSVDHLRFFNEAGLDDFFWARDPGSYFRRSALFSRPREMKSVFFDSLPAETRLFSPTWDPTIVTTAPLRFARPENAAERTRSFAVFFSPRPWPVWMQTIPLGLRPADPLPLSLALVLSAAAGAAMLLRTTRRLERP